MSVRRLRPCPPPWLPLQSADEGVAHILTAKESGGVATSPRSLLASHESNFSSLVFPALGVGQRLPSPRSEAGSSAGAPCSRNAHLHSPLCNLSAKASATSLLTPRTKSLSLRCGAPNAEAGTTLARTSYPSPSRPETTAGRARLHAPRTF